MMNISAAAPNKLLGKFFKDVRKQNGGEYEVFQAFKRVYSSYLRLAHSSPFSASLPQEAPLSRFSSEAMPHPSVFARVNKHPLNFQLSLQQLP